jgi:hypothetical protein
MYVTPDVEARIRGAMGIFISTLSGLAFETIPFLLLGTLLSAAIQSFVPDRAIRRAFPKNHYLSILVALGLGVLMPICECATVPLAKRLREKGLPLSTAVAFLLAAPLVNPMTIASTYVAFNGTGHAVFLQRLGLGLVASFTVAAVVELFSRRFGALEEVAASPLAGLIGVQSFPATPLLFPETKAQAAGLGTRIIDMFEHASYDFLDMARYLIAGISIAALARACIPASALSKYLGAPAIATGAGLGSAYVLSLCSSADAFVGRSLFAPISYNALLGFLVLGPMLDLKNTILLARFVKPQLLFRFVILVALVVGILVFAVTPLMEAL